jgi:MSHA biogenesis protein MshI
MRGLFSRRDREPGWLAISLQPGVLHYAHGVHAGGKASIERCGKRALDVSAKVAADLSKELGFERYRCSTVLPSGEYQLLLVDTPGVPAAELKTAVRWRIKDLLDDKVEEATVDFLEVPPDPAAGGRSRWTYAVAARNEAIKRCIGRFDAAEIPLSVIDIAETAQRNIASLFETAGQGLAFLTVEASQALLTINFRGELYLARRIDIGVDDLQSEGREASREDSLARIALELQRSFDHFDRQFPFVRIAKLLLGPEPRDTGLGAHLAQNLDLPVEATHLHDVIAFGEEAKLDEQSTWELFPVLGAALRA